MRRITSMRWLYQVFCLLLVVSISTAFNPVMAQDDDEPLFTSDNFTSRVVSIKGSIVECEGGFFADLSNADISSYFSNRTINDLEVGLPITVEGKIDPSQSSSSRTFFKAESVKALGLRKEVNIAGLLQKIDESRSTITIFNHEIGFNSDTKLLKKTKKRLKAMPLSSLESGVEVTVEADVTPTGLVARRIVKGLHPINGAQLSGFLTKADNGILEFPGGFLVDVSKLLSPNFPQPRPDTLVSVGNFVLLKDNPDMLLSFAYSFSDPANSPFSMLDLHLGGVDAANRTITVFNRTIPVSDSAEIYIGSNPGTLSNVKAGQRTGVGFVVTERGLLVDSISQF
jgi:hypothetical protein